MIEIVVIIAIYSVVVLIFVPLERIGKAQTAVKNWVKRITDKANE